MLFGYPLAATTENWLHDALIAMLTTIHTNLDVGAPPAAWPAIIPEAQRDELRIRTGLRDRLLTYQEAVTAMTPAERQQIASCLTQQNRISELCSGAVDCEVLDQLPESSRGPIREVFEFAFSLLSAIGVRDRHYRAIYQAAKSHVCPFCGCEYFDAPGAPREDLDHYLAKSRYPFAGANLRNLVPMGMRCNERYKLDADILRSVDGDRRPAFDPYAERNLQVQLRGSIPFAGADGRIPAWSIEFDPNEPSCATWDEVFAIRERIRRDVLDPSFFRWLGDFAAWFKRHVAIPAPDLDTVIGAIHEYAEEMAFLGFSARDFLRVPVFQMLHERCSSGDERLSALMIDLVAIGEAV